MSSSGIGIVKARRGVREHNSDLRLIPRREVHNSIQQAGRSAQFGPRVFDAASMRLHQPADRQYERDASGTKRARSGRPGLGRGPSNLCPPPSRPARSRTGRVAPSKAPGAAAPRLRLDGPLRRTMLAPVRGRRWCAAVPRRRQQCASHGVSRGSHSAACAASSSIRAMPSRPSDARTKAKPPARARLLAEGAASPSALSPIRSQCSPRAPSPFAGAAMGSVRHIGAERAISSSPTAFSQLRSVASLPSVDVVGEVGPDQVARSLDRPPPRSRAPSPGRHRHARSTRHLHEGAAGAPSQALGDGAPT